MAWVNVTDEAVSGQKWALKLRLQSFVCTGQRRRRNRWCSFSTSKDLILFRVLAPCIYLFLFFTFNIQIKDKNRSQMTGENLCSVSSFWSHNLERKRWETKPYSTIFTLNLHVCTNLYYLRFIVFSQSCVLKSTFVASLCATVWRPVFKSCFQYFEPNQPISITFNQWICDESGGCSRVWRPQAATRPFKQERLKRGNSLDLTYLCFLPPPSWLTALWSDVAPHI